jgi:hypothetical protein
MPLYSVFFFLSGFAVGMVIGSLVMLAFRA